MAHRENPSSWPRFRPHTHAKSPTVGESPPEYVNGVDILRYRIEETVVIVYRDLDVRHDPESIRDYLNLWHCSRSSGTPAVNPYR